MRDTGDSTTDTDPQIASESMSPITPTTRKLQPRRLKLGHITPTQASVVRLLGNPSLRQPDIADLVGCSLAYVHEIERALKDRLQAGSALELELYRRQLRKRVPDSARVGAIETAVGRAKSNPFAALRAVEYADAVLGLGPRQGSQVDEQPALRVPMFVLPAGTKILMHIGGDATGDKQETTKAIDVQAIESKGDA